MSGTRVKICGITREVDAELAVRSGADALGFNFWAGSKRRCDFDTARRIIDGLPPFVIAVGVFVNPRRDEVERAIERTGIAVVQLHGDESPRLCERIRRPVIKAIRVDGPDSLAGAEEFPVAGLLLDAPSRGFGGSGRTFDWELASRLPPGRPIILAGGLDPRNVARAVRAVRPYAVDVASGVESSPGIKDPRKLARFIQAAKET